MPGARVQAVESGSRVCDHTRPPYFILIYVYYKGYCVIWMPENRAGPIFRRGDGARGNTERLGAARKYFMRIAVESFGAVIDAATGESLACEAFAAEVERRAALLRHLDGICENSVPFVVIAHGGTPSFLADLFAVWQAGDAAGPVDSSPEDPALVLFTSGASGKPMIAALPLAFADPVDAE